VEAHLIPSLSFGITALNGEAEAKVFLELNAASFKLCFLSIRQVAFF